MRLTAVKSMLCKPYDSSGIKYLIVRVGETHIKHSFYSIFRRQIGIRAVAHTEQAYRLFTHNNLCTHLESVKPARAR